jgi:hypothetical protein
VHKAAERITNAKMCLLESGKYRSRAFERAWGAPVDSWEPERLHFGAVRGILLGLRRSLDPGSSRFIVGQNAGFRRSLRRQYG